MQFKTVEHAIKYTRRGPSRSERKCPMGGTLVGQGQQLALLTGIGAGDGCHIEPQRRTVS